MKKVKLIGPTGTETIGTYEIIEAINKDVIKVRNEDGHTLRVHVSRIQELEDEEMAKKEKAEKEKAVKTKAVKEVQPFDVPAWVVGRKHLKKESGFDHKQYKVTSHIVIDGNAGYFYTLNTYLQPNGVVSLGKGNKGGNQYPLKGKSVKIGTKTIVGKKTAEEVEAEKIKKGYKLA